MSTPVSTAVRTGGPGAADGGGTGRKPPWRRTPVLIAVGMVLALLVVSVLARDDARFDGPLDPRNPGRDGAQAVAEVLARHGVEVDLARGQDALLDQRVDGATTVVVTNPTDLGRSTFARLRRHVGASGRLVLAGDAAPVGALLRLRPTPGPDGARDAGCDDGPVAGLAVRTEDGTGLAGTGCFASGAGALLVRRNGVLALTAADTLSNDHVLEADNAAVALRLLGQRDRLVWYVADSSDTAVGDGVRLGPLLPDWLLPALSLLAAAVVALVLWRGRRLGPLVTEPIPVVVRAVESTRSRGQIYRRTRDRQHAGRILAEATRRRLEQSLRLPPGSTPETLVAAVAARTGRDPRAVHQLLADPVVDTDTRLVDLGRRLIELEDEVRTT